ncbi:hypothetical protein Gotri_019337 [Gossypium trilobum]|uniref:Protein kinase domain-containing protein n=1 Tax=Gossypium trilobum TaxID=34281 RepID=A0A7J9ED27_9ROSI|nr:hypothetical protein [Gossypium trilobum]
MMFRLNVDGQSIPPSKDADGLLRSWIGREMGPKFEVIKFNLTWLFQVDANFTYIVRLHLCNEMVQIDIAPSTLLNPKFYDALLNGVEIFKLNNGNKNLAGSSNLQLSAMLRQSTDELPNSIAFKSNNGVASAWVGGRAAAAFMVVAILVFAYSNNSLVSTLSQGLSHHFSISKIKQATKDFDECNMVRVGVGGFGKVYEGVIDGGTKMAIKRSNPSLKQRVSEFQTEVEMLSKLKHKH